ncbi:unnamed protein product, partial [Diamesa serratosioi]
TKYKELKQLYEEKKKSFDNASVHIVLLRNDLALMRSNNEQHIKYVQSVKEKQAIMEQHIQQQQKIINKLTILNNTSQERDVDLIKTVNFSDKVKYDAFKEEMNRMSTFNDGNGANLSNEVPTTKTTMTKNSTIDQQDKIDELQRELVEQQRKYSIEMEELKEELAKVQQELSAAKSDEREEVIKVTQKNLELYNKLHKSQLEWTYNSFRRNSNVQRNKEKENRTGKTMTTKRKRQRTRIGQWNVRTLYQKGKLAQVNKEFSRLKLEVLGL